MLLKLSVGVGDKFHRKCFGTEILTHITLYVESSYGSKCIMPNCSFVGTEVLRIIQP